MFFPLLVEVCVVIVADICFALLFLKTTKLREGPGQFILIQTQAQIIVDLHWLLLYIEKIQISNTACTALALVAYLGFTISCTYAAAICVAVSLHCDRPKYPNLWRYHLAVIAISLPLSLITFLGGGDEQGGYFNSCSVNLYSHESWAQ